MNDPVPPDSASAPQPVADWRGLLLHRLPDDQAAELEQRLLSDDEALDALLEAEHDLYDDCARLALTAAEHQAFEQHLLVSPAARERLRISRALKPAPARPARYQPARTQPPRRSRRSLWFLASGAVIAAGLAIAVVLLDRHTREVDAEIAADSTAAPTLLLLASVQRGSQRPAVALSLSSDAGQLRVQAEVEQPEDGASYRISLLAEGAGDGPGDSAEPLLKLDGLPLATLGRYRFVEALLPARLLSGEVRILRVEALPPASAFSFEWTISSAATKPER